jgi:hypothetical protein
MFNTEPAGVLIPLHVPDDELPPVIFPVKFIVPVEKLLIVTALLFVDDPVTFPVKFKVPFPSNRSAD